MVKSVCRRLLLDPDDVEDVVQERSEAGGASDTVNAATRG
jgi:hypothetical protein